MLKQKKIFVTGGTGFVGSHLVSELVDLGNMVTTTFQTVNPLSYFFSKKIDQKVRMVDIDINNFNALFDIITKHQIEYIFHLAAQPLVDVAYDNPRRTLETNINGTINVLESARLFSKIKGVIVASSDKAYGKLTKKKYLESDPLRGDHPYEASKSAADLIAYTYFQTYGVPVITTRFGNIYGEGDLNFSRIIPGVLESLILNKSLEIRSDGSYVRDYLYVKDVVRGYLMLAGRIDQIKGEAFNFGSDDTLSVLELIKIVERAIGRRVKYQILNSTKNEIPYQSLDFKKIQNEISWKPKFSIATSIKHIKKWYGSYFKKL